MASTLDEYQDLVQELRKSPETAGSEKLSKFLRLVRELHIRDSQGVTQYGGLLLKSHRRSLGEEELWLVHEQVAVAALDVGAFPFAATLIRAVAKRFPDSLRMKRLKGMYWEAQGQYDQAEEIYKDMILNRPTCEIAHKRLVALCKTRGKLNEAVEGLRSYLEHWSNDREAWEELGDLYLELLMYRQALFCYEELLMHAPGHLPYLVRYADILYTLGGNNNLRIARAYYAKAVELSGGTSARALWGVMLCSANSTEKVSLQDSRTRAQIELPELAAQSLLRQYKQQAPGKQEIVTSLLEKALPSK